MSFSYKNPNDFIVHLKKGNEQAYVHLIKTYHKILLNYAFSLANDYEMAQDIVQDVFLDIWKGRRKLKPMGSLKNYIYKITYHKFINQYHKHRAISSLERAYIESIDEVFDDSSAELLERKIALVAEGIDKLPVKCKEVFLLSRKEGLINVEIAEYMNISIKTVEGHLTKAYRFFLREYVGSHLNLILLLLIGVHNPRTKIVFK